MLEVKSLQDCMHETGWFGSESEKNNLMHVLLQIYILNEIQGRSLLFLVAQVRKESILSSGHWVSSKLEQVFFITPRFQKAVQKK